MNNNLKLANFGCLLLIVAIVASLLAGGGAFFLFALGMSGGGSGDSAIPYAGTVFIVVAIAVVLSCLLTPISGVGGLAFVGISTVREIYADLKSGTLSGEPYQFRWARVGQVLAIGFALLLIFNFFSANLLNYTEGSLAFSSISSGTVLFQILILPFLTMVGSLVGGLGYARFRSRDSATALGSLVGGGVLGALACVGLIVYLILR